MQRILLFAAGAAFCTMAVVFMLKTLAETAFLAEFGSTYVPHFFVAQSVAVVSLSAGYGALIKRMKALPFDLIILFGLAVVSLFAPPAIELGGAWVFVVTLILISVSSLAFLAVWNAATEVVRGRRARTFVAQASAAATAGAMTGGFAASGVVATTGVVWLGPVAGVLLCAIGALQIVLTRANVNRGRRSAASHQRERATRRATSKVARQLVQLVIAAAVVEAILAAVVDFGFKEVVSERFDREQMGLFFALFYGVCNVFILILQLFITTRLLAAKSLRFTLSLQPLALLCICVLWFLVPVLALVALARSCESVMKFGLGRPAQELALGPLIDQQKQRAKVLIRGVFGQGGAAVAGLLLIAAASLLAEYPGLLAAAAASLAGLWLILQRRVARLYLATLSATLGMRRLPAHGPHQAAMLDRDGLAEVVAMLGEGDRERARLAREILASAAPDAPVLADHLVASDNPQVRKTLYEQLAQSPGPTSTRSLREAVLNEDPAGGALAAGLTALAACRDPAATKLARTLATGSPEDSDELPRAAWRYLAQVGALGGEPEKLRAVLRTTLAHDGLRAAAMYQTALELGQIDEPLVDADVAAATQSSAERRPDDGMAGQSIGWYINAPVEDTSPDRLWTLASKPDEQSVDEQSVDEEPEDHRGAAEAFKVAAVLGRLKPLTELLKAIEMKRVGAEEALGHLDSVALHSLMMLVNARDASPRARARILRGLRRCDVPACIDVAADALSDGDPRVRDAAVRTLLHKARDGQVHIPRREVEDALTHELERFRVYLYARPPYPSNVRESSIAFRHEAALVLDAEVFFLDELERCTEQNLAKVCELLALLGNPNEIYAAARELRAPTLKRRLKAVDILQEVVRGAQRTRLFDLLDRYLQPKRPTARDRAAVCELDPWLARCSGDEFAPIRSRLSGLRAAPLFDGVPGRALIELAKHTTEFTCERGEVVIREGDPGDALYVVMSGRLMIERGSEKMLHLVAGKSFGELALIDGQPRQVTVRTVTGARLLRLPREPFRQALREFPEIYLGLMRCLATWLR
ncbi:MAG: cyclic nucleotide-binding domain-containing protein [Proteobacteria bacterium]|nr:cyclic nucleotide-binding domain-containing protein [Pseudomonadota bacterium]